MNWLPIETAPEDELVLVWSSDRGIFALWKDPEPDPGAPAWVCPENKTRYEQSNFSHWTELPDPPKNS